MLSRAYLPMQLPMQPMRFPGHSFRDQQEFEHYLSSVKPKAQYHQTRRCKCISQGRFYPKCKTRAVLRRIEQDAEDGDEPRELDAFKAPDEESGYLATRRYFDAGTDTRPLAFEIPKAKTTNVVWNFYILKNNLIQNELKANSKKNAPLFRSIQDVILHDKRLEILYSRDILSQSFRTYLTKSLSSDSAQQVMKRLAVQIDIAKQMMPIVCKALIYGDTIFQRRYIRKYREEMDAIERQRKALFATELAQ